MECPDQPEPEPVPESLVKQSEPQEPRSGQQCLVAVTDESMDPQQQSVDLNNFESENLVGTLLSNRSPGNV